jgi:hypothetical protein
MTGSRPYLARSFTGNRSQKSRPDNLAFRHLAKYEDGKSSLRQTGSEEETVGLETFSPAGYRASSEVLNCGKIHGD